MRFRDLVVVETAVGLAAPLVTRVLAEFGARAIKVESGTRPDFTRTRLRPPGMSQEEFDDQPVHDMGASKSSVTINLKHEAGREVFLRLLERADVFVENYAPGWLERIGLSLDAITARAPRLIVLSQAAYGGEGPLCSRRAYAPIMSSLAGLDSLVGYDDGRVMSQTAMATGDVIAAYSGVALVLAALVERERTGLGAVIDQSQTESTASLLGVAFAEYGLTGEIPQPAGNGSPADAPHGVYPASGRDRWVALAVWSDAEWRELEAALALEHDARFETAAGRLANREALDALVSARTALEGRDELADRLQARGLSCTPVLDCDEFDLHPAHVDRRLWEAFPGPGGRGEVRITQIPWRGEHLELRTTFAAEGLGESTARVLGEVAGYDPAAIERLTAEGALS